MNSIEPELMQRLVDGELDAEATRKILVAAEGTPQLWRNIAVRFVEETTWRRAFSSAEFLEPQGGADLPSSSTKPAQPTSTNADKPLGNNVSPQENSGWMRGLVLAAAVMVAITGGYLAGKSMNLAGSINPSTDTALASNNTPSDSNPPLVENTLDDVTENQLTTTPVSYEPDYHMQLTDQYGNPVMNSDVPMYGQQNARKMGVLNTRRLPVEFVRRVSDSGYGIDQNTNFISGQLNDGRRFVVPVRTINLNPGL